jgi:hypothetical protein
LTGCVRSEDEAAEGNARRVIARYEPASLAFQCESPCIVVAKSAGHAVHRHRARSDRSSTGPRRRASGLSCRVLRRCGRGGPRVCDPEGVSPPANSRSSYFSVSVPGSLSGVIKSSRRRTIVFFWRLEILFVYMPTVKVGAKAYKPICLDYLICNASILLVHSKWYAKTQSVGLKLN